MAIGHDGAVLDPTFRGFRYWPIIRYAECMPGLICAIAVPVGPLNLDDYPDTGPIRVWPTFLRRLTGGNVYGGATSDCVATVAAILRDGSVIVPRRIVSLTCYAPADSCW